MINLKLFPKTNKAKTVINRFGSIWKVLEERIDKFAIVSIIEECCWSSSSVRWINKIEDKDFIFDIIS